MIAAGMLDVGYCQPDRTGSRWGATVQNRRPMTADMPALRDHAELASGLAYPVASCRQVP